MNEWQTVSVTLYNDRDIQLFYTLTVKGVVNCQNSRDKGPPEGNSARG